MSAITNNLTNIEWWFNGLFFTLLAFTPKLYFYTIPRFKRFFRNRSTKELKAIRLIRQDDVKVLREVFHEKCLFLIFILGATVYIYSFVANNIFLDIETYNQDKMAHKLNIIFTLSIPVYVLEIMYIRRRYYIKTLFKYRDRLKK
jgi:hypothetical protein